MEIRAFRGWRYRTAPGGDISALIAPPYDILSDKDKQNLLARNDHNIVAVDMPHVPPKELGPDAVYQAAAKRLADWQAAGAVVQDEPAIYAYQQEFSRAGRTYRRRAILCGVRATELGKDVIPHEHTFAGPKADRLRLTECTRTQLSPIFGFYNDPGRAVETLLGEITRSAPDLQGTLGEVGEKLWVIRDPQRIAAIAAALKSEPVFIADGHHRYTTALNYRDRLAGGGKLRDDHEANFVMFALVAKDDPGLVILPTHRVISKLAADFSIDKLVASAGDFRWQRCEGPANFSIPDADALLQPFGPTAMAFVAPGGKDLWVATLANPAAMQAAAPEQLDAWRKLDVAILHKLIVEKALAPWTSAQTAIEYTPDSQAVVEACRAGRASLGICLQATPLEAVESIARAGASMPHKSTYFYPKLATGLVLKPLE
ncbi:MAG: DUF1015 domain-containing protein [Phycisphaerae bacterium]|jgi:uncharacterized protein (DUF1015 family)